MSQEKKQGKGHRSCKRCGTHRALIRSFNIDLCRRCFREVAEELGFRKFS